MVVNTDVISLYEMLAPLPRAKQSALRNRIKPDMEAALWTHNLRVFISTHPELTSAQRAVLEEGIELLKNPLLFELDPGTHDAATKQRLAAHSAAAEAAFSPADIIALFFRFGPEPFETPPPDGAGLNVAPQSNSTCNCRSWYDCNPIWPSVRCFNDPDVMCIFVQSGCGWYGTDGCNGVC